MNRQQYIEALTFCLKAETAGAIAGEVAMLLRSDDHQRRQLDLFRRIEASNKRLCWEALRRAGVDRPTPDRSFYRVGYKVGLWLGEGDWNSFLDRFRATIHPEVFEKYLAAAQDDYANEGADDAYDGVEVALFAHLVEHEHALTRFVAQEREGRSDAATEELASVLNGQLCAGLVGPDDPVGW